MSVDLSGGFDSSVVVGLLGGQRSQHEIVSYHHQLDSLDPSERHFAKKAAEYACVPFEIIKVSPNRPLPSLETHPLSVRPYRQFVALDLAADMRSILKQNLNVIETTFTGQGGDHLFVAGRSPLIFADFVRRHGIVPETLKQLIAAARLSNRSVWSVLKHSIPYILSPNTRSSMVRSIQRRRTLVTNGVHDTLDAVTCVPDWARTSKGLPPAKFNQISSLIHLLHTRETMERSWTNNVVHPLMAEPIVELCLRFPMPLLCVGGESRGLARMAFKGVIPESIRRRVTKGDASRFFMNYLTVNIRHIADSLVNGELVANGIIERASVEDFIEHDNYSVYSNGRMMLVYYSIEAWLRRWRSLGEGCEFAHAAWAPTDLSDKPKVIRGA